MSGVERQTHLMKTRADGHCLRCESIHASLARRISDVNAYLTHLLTAAWCSEVIVGEQTKGNDAEAELQN